MARQQRGTKRPGLIRGYSFAWVTAGFFIISFTGHWLFGWFAFVKSNAPIRSRSRFLSMSCR
jgi:hypothetical protein